MSQSAVKRLDSGLPEILPEGESEFENGQDVIEQLATMPRYAFIRPQWDQPMERIRLIDGTAAGTSIGAGAAAQNGDDFIGH